MKIEGSWADLRTRGYVVVRNFLDSPLVAEAAAAVRADGNAASQTLAAETDRAVRARVSSMFADIEAQSGIRLTHTTGTRVFPNRLHYLHSDDTPYWYFQDFTEYVNFWIPVIKPERKVSGIKLIPFDLLKEHARVLADVLENNGCADFVPTRVAQQGQDAINAHFFDPVAMRTMAKDDESQTMCIERDGLRKPVFCDFDVRKLFVAPECDAGDAIILRGDILHQTQDALTTRLAISGRAMNGSRPIRRSFYDQLSIVSRTNLSKATVPATNIFGAFHLHGLEEMPASNLIDFMGDLASKKEHAVAAADAVRPRIAELLKVAPPAPTS